MSRRLVFAALFIAIFAALHAGYTFARGTWLERMLVDRITVTPAAALINLLTPRVQASAEGHRIRASGGSLSILGGCEGTESMFLLVAAFLAFPMPWRQRLLGMVGGVSLIYALNQGRILALFYAFRHDRELFALLHGTVLPVVVIVGGSAFFLWWAGRGQPPA